MADPGASLGPDAEVEGEPKYVPVATCSPTLPSSPTCLTWYPLTPRHLLCLIRDRGWTRHVCGPPSSTAIDGASGARSGRHFE